MNRQEKRARPRSALGGSNGTRQVYISGLTDHRLKNADIVDHLVEKGRFRLELDSCR